MAWAFGFRNLVIPGGVAPISGQPFDMARNTGCMRMLENNFDYIFFLDSDVIPPHDAVIRLMKHDLPIVSGVYCRRSPPHMHPVAMKGGQWLPFDLPQNQLLEVDVVGAGCLLIRRDVLEKMKPIAPEQGAHWFHWRVDMSGLLPPGEALSEDYAFCLHAKRQLGISTILDTSVRARHVGLAQSMPGSFLPCDHTPVT